MATNVAAVKRGWHWDAANSRLSCYVNGLEALRLTPSTTGVDWMILGDTPASYYVAFDASGPRMYVPSGVELDCESGSTLTVAGTFTAADKITSAHIADNALDSEHYTDGSIDLAHLSADCVDGTKIADNAIDSEHYTDGSIDLAHMSANSVDSSQYVDASIDKAHLATEIYTIEHITFSGEGLDNQTIKLARMWSAGTVVRITYFTDQALGTNLGIDVLDGGTDGAGTTVIDSCSDNLNGLDSNDLTTPLALSAGDYICVKVDDITNSTFISVDIQVKVPCGAAT